VIVQCLRSDSSCFGHYNPSNIILAYLLTYQMWPLCVAWPWGKDAVQSGHGPRGGLPATSGGGTPASDGLSPPRGGLAAAAVIVSE